MRSLILMMLGGNVSVSVHLSVCLLTNITHKAMDGFRFNFHEISNRGPVITG